MKEKADLLVVNGKIYILDEVNTLVECVAIRKGKIIWKGSTQNAYRRFNTKETLDLEGKAVFPGFIDPHCHFYGLAKNFQYVDLVGSTSFEEVINRVKSFTSPLPDGWIVGRGWDQNKWTEEKFPENGRLDKEFPGTPIVLIRIDGHAALASDEALKQAGINWIERFKPDEVETRNGLMTGILRENACDFIRSVVPAPDKKGKVRLLRKAEELCFSYGLTGVSDAGLDYEIVQLLDSMQRRGLLKINLYVMLNPTMENIDQFVLQGPYETGKLTVRSIKLYADGSLGSRTALLKQPYSDAPGTSGILVTQVDSIRQICKLGLAHGYQVNTHAIGDSAVKLILDIYGEFLKNPNDLRWRIEHAQVVDRKDVHLFNDYSIIPSIQATHATSDMFWAACRLGPVRLTCAYAYHTLLEQNGWLPNGTDFPIENVSPLLSFYAAVARKDIKGQPEQGFQMENGLTREEAIRSMTLWAARANFWETTRGSLENGKSADFVILSNDIMTIPMDEVPSVRVLKSFIAGEQVFPK